MTTNVGKKIKKRGLSFRKTNQKCYKPLNLIGTTNLQRTGRPPLIAGLNRGNSCQTFRASFSNAVSVR